MGVYELSLEAEDDLYAIWFFGLGRFGEVQADKYYYGLLNHFEDIADSPNLYPAVDYILKGCRRSVFKAHAIYYRQQQDFIEIMRIYGQQNPDNL